MHDIVTEMCKKKQQLNIFSYVVKSKIHCSVLRIIIDKHIWSVYASLAVKGSRDIRHVVSLGRPFTVQIVIHRSISISDDGRSVSIDGRSNVKVSRRFPQSPMEIPPTATRNATDTRIRMGKERRREKYIYINRQREISLRIYAPCVMAFGTKRMIPRQRIYYNTSRAG